MPDPPHFAPLPWWRRWQVTLLTVPLVVALVVAAAEVADVLRTFRRVEAAALTKQAETATALAAATELFVARYAAIAETAAQALFTTRAAEDARHALLASLRGLHPEIDVAAAIDWSGRILDADPPLAIGHDVSQRADYQRLLRGASTAVSDLRVGQRTGHPGITIAAAGRGPGGALRGLVVLGLPAAALRQEVRLPLSGDAYTVVVDQTGRAIVHSAWPNLEWDRRDFSRLPLVAEALAGRPARASDIRSPLTGRRLLGAMIPVPELGWAVGVLQPLDTALAPAWRERRIALGRLAAVLGVGISLALLLGAWLSRPVIALADGVAALARGDLRYRVPVRWRNEFGRLAETFNAMAGRLEATVSELEGTQHRTAFLADASARLGGSLDSQAIYTIAARLVVRELADGCIVDAVQADGSTRAILAVAAGPGGAELVSDVPQRFPDLGGSHPAAQALRTGQAQLAPVLTDAWLSALAADIEQLTARRLPAPRSYLCIPLIARGQPLAALSCFSTTPQRCYGPAELALVEEVARRVATALDNARLYHEAQEAIRVRDEFLARASHELRTPLTVVKGHLGLLTKPEMASPKTAGELIAVACRQVDRMVRLVSDLLDASRLQAGRLQLYLEPLDLKSVVAEALAQVRPLAETKAVVLVDAVSAGQPSVGDRLKLEQVVINLLTNAIKHTPGGGRVGVEVAAKGAARELRVWDTGAGIAREHLERVFEPFFQVGSATGRQKAAGQGTGLGLAIVKRLVELHGGRIWAESEGLGRGSTFVVRLPIDSARSRAG